MFAVSVPATTLLSTSPPTAFRFLGNGPVAPIDVRESLLEVSTGESLTLVGGDLTIAGAPHPEAEGRSVNDTLRAPGGVIALASVQSAGSVALAPDGAVDVGEFAALGDIELSALAARDPVSEEGGNTVLDVAGDPGGRVVIRGGRLTMADSALISGATLGDRPHPGTAVDIEITSEMDMGPGTEIGVSTFGLGDAGDVSIRADRLTMTGDPESPAFGGFGLNANIGARTFGEELGGSRVSGDGGDVLIDVGDFVMNDRTFIQTTTFSNGLGGDIVISAETVEMTSRRSVTFISASAAGTGDAGSVVIDIDATGDVRILDGAQLSGGIFFGGGDGGDITIAANTLEVAGTSLDSDGNILCAPACFTSGIFSSADDFQSFGGTPANGGDIIIDVTNLIVRDGGTIRNAAEFPSSANAGNTTITASSVLLANSGSIVNDSFGFGDGGLIAMTTDTLSIEGPSLFPTFVGTGIFCPGWHRSRQLEPNSAGCRRSVDRRWWFDPHDHVRHGAGGPGRHRGQHDSDFRRRRRTGDRRVRVRSRWRRIQHHQRFADLSGFRRFLRR